MEIVAVDQEGARVVGTNCMLARGGTGAVAPVLELTATPRQDAAAEAGVDEPAQHQCEHFSIRGYVALLQKKDPKFCSLSRIFHDQKKCDEHKASSSPFSVAKFRRWDCSKCLDKLKTSDNGTAPRTLPAKQNGTSDGCSITFVRSTFVPASVGSQKVSPSTQSSQGKNADRSTLPKSVQEGNDSKCNAPSGKNGAAEANTDSPMKDLQGPAQNYDVAANVSEDNTSVDVGALPEVPQITWHIEVNGADQPPSTPKLSEVVLKRNEDENGKTEETLVAEQCNLTKDPNPMSGKERDQVAEQCNLTKDPKPVSGQKCEQICNEPCEEVVLKRSSKSKRKTDKKLMKKQQHSKKRTAQADVSDAKLCRRKPKKVRLLSEIINANQVEDSRSDEVHRENAADPCEDDRSTIPVPMEVSMDIPVSNHTVGEDGLKSSKNKTKRKYSDVLDDGSSLMNWLNGKKKRTGSVHHTVAHPAGNLSNKKVTPTASTQHDDENDTENGLDTNMHKTDVCQHVSEISTQRCSSKGKTAGLSKGKTHSAASTKYGGESTRNGQNIHVLSAEDQCQMETENSVLSHSAKVSPAEHDIQIMSDLHEQSLPKKKKKQKLEVTREKQTMIDDIPMDIVELLAKNQHERQLMTETDCSDINRIQSKTTADDDCVIVAAKDGSDYASSVFDTNSQQKSLASQSTQKELQGHLALTTQESPHPQNFQSTQEQQTHLRMEEMVTIAASSPLFSHHDDQYIAEAPTEHWGRKDTKKLTWEQFKATTRNSPAATCGAQFRPGIQAVDLTSTHVMGSSSNYASRQPVIAPLDRYAERAVNQVHARNFPSTIATMEASKLCDRRNAGQVVLYPKESMPATHLLRMMDPSTLASFPNYGTSSRNQMESQLHSSQYAHNQYKGSTSTSYGSNLNGKIPLTFEDLSRHQLHDLHRPLRPHPRVGVLGSLLQKEIANWSENCGTQSGYKLGVSTGITSHQMNRKEHFEALNSGMFSAKWNALQLGSVSSSADFLSARNSIAQSWTRGKGKMVHPLDRFVRQDICITNKNPADFTTISNDNEYMDYR
uniref:Embryonic flower 1-like protein n=3 Tax=Oryza barthii TaxID=65489 RepID=A0A0D3ELC9_9ORYZ